MTTALAHLWMWRSRVQSTASRAVMKRRMLQALVVLLPLLLAAALYYFMSVEETVVVPLPAKKGLKSALKAAKK